MNNQPDYNKNSNEKNIVEKIEPILKDKIDEKLESKNIETIIFRVDSSTSLILKNEKKENIIRKKNKKISLKDIRNCLTEHISDNQIEIFLDYNEKKINISSENIHFLKNDDYNITKKNNFHDKDENIKLDAKEEKEKDENKIIEKKKGIIKKAKTLLQDNFFLKENENNSNNFEEFDIYYYKMCNLSLNSLKFLIVYEFNGKNKKFFIFENISKEYSEKEMDSNFIFLIKNY